MAQQFKRQFSMPLSSDKPETFPFRLITRATDAPNLPSIASALWYTLNLANNQFNAVQFGIATDKPVAG
ncbi:MAG: hypothetical protein WKG07_40830 [Hymenobacter sp.]